MESLIKLQAQISIYSGRKTGGLVALQDMVRRMENDESTICECCGGEGYRGRTPWHSEDCPIVKRCEIVMSDEQTKIIHNTTKDLVAKFLRYNRKEDEELPVGAIEDAIKSGETSISEIVSVFELSLIHI